MAPVEIYMYERPLALPAALAPASAALAAGAAQRPQAHQVLAQTEWAQALLSDGSNGFTGMGIRGSNKRTDVRGVPPRGRPV